MIRRLIVGLIWLAVVQSEAPGSVPMKEGLKEGLNSSMDDAESPKSKRYLTHEHVGHVGSPCPPFYPNFGAHTKIHDTRPYGPPAYPKSVSSHTSHMYHGHQELQYVHAPSYASYVPHQTIQLIKPEHKAPMYKAPVYQAPIWKAPVYQAPVWKAPIHQAPIYKAQIYKAPIHQAQIYKAPMIHEAQIYKAPIHEAQIYKAPIHEAQIYKAPIHDAQIYKAPIHEAQIYKAPIYHEPIWKPAVQHQPTIVKLPSYYHHYQPPMYHEPKYYSKMPVFSYAPAYQKPMLSVWPSTDVKKYDLPTNHISYHQPTIVYKPEAPKCAPCPPVSHSPETSYVKVVQTPHVEQSKVYLPPAPVVHHPVVKPCVH